MKIVPTEHFRQGGFALVFTLSLMVLLTVISVALLNLSVISLRSASIGSAQAEARANARMGLMLAIGELQKEMGPDMRVSAEAALFDTNKQTEAIEGVAQPHWMASYNSWGNWLNDSFTPDGGSTPLTIQNTYTEKREKMFRRWLLSLPAGSETNVNAPISLGGWDDSNSVVLVGKGSLSSPEPETRAYLTPVGKSITGITVITGKNAWWISPENHKARIDMAKNPRTLPVDEWQTAQGNTAEVGVGSLPGFAALEADASLGERLVTTLSLRPAQVGEDKVKERFFDVTANSQGVIASVRSGHLKKDLSLLFEKDNEKDNSALPAPYKFNIGSDIREPSIRPMSPELTAKNPKIPNRQFASWTNMRHYYRMYRAGSDATPTEKGKTGALTWSGSKPSTDFATPALIVNQGVPLLDGSNHYWRAPILAKMTMIYSLVAKPDPTPGKFLCLYRYSPVFTFWNPYNVELVIPSGQFQFSAKPYQLLPINQMFYLNGVYQYKTAPNAAANFRTVLSSVDDSDIVFKPGELRVFSLRNTGTFSGPDVQKLLPGFDPAAADGDERNLSAAAFRRDEKPGAAYEFSSAQFGGGVHLGNTGGAMVFDASWFGTPGANFPMPYSNDWFQRSPRNQTFTPMTPPGVNNLHSWEPFDGNPKIVAYAQMAIKGLFKFDYPSITWGQDWRCRNWVQAPPFYFGSGMYMSMDNTIAHTQRLDCPYILNFGPTTTFGISKIVGQLGDKAFLGASEQVTSAAMLELPTAPLGSLAGFSNMRINPGWVSPSQYLKRVSTDPLRVFRFVSPDGWKSQRASLYAAECKRVTYQSGVTGPGIGNSFMHPMLPRDGVYRFIDNSKSQDTIIRTAPNGTETVDTMAYCDYWDHVLLLNDALWDDYFVSSLADQTRPGASNAVSLSNNLDRLIAQDPTKPISNVRYRYYSGGKSTTAAKTELSGTNGYLSAAKYLMVDGMFNVNSTSVAAWRALFAGIRERQLVFRDNSGAVQKINVPSDKRIALSRFDTEVSDQEMDDPGQGVTMPDGSKGWSGVRFLDDGQITTLAEECVKQVKKRGPFLNFSEFINRRLSNDDLGTMGALQSAIDYDDKNPNAQSINYRFKQTGALMITKSDLGVAASDPDVTKRFSTPEAAEGSRLAGIPGYIIQSDLLKPIANTLAVRDDTFRIRAYGESLVNGKVVARAHCEAVVQRMPEYQDPTNDANVPARLLIIDPQDPSKNGTFSDNPALSTSNIRFGRKFRIVSFRWLNASEV